MLSMIMGMFFQEVTIFTRAGHKDHLHVVYLPLKVMSPKILRLLEVL